MSVVVDDINIFMNTNITTSFSTTTFLVISPTRSLFVLLTAPDNRSNRRCLRTVEVGSRW